MPPPPDAKPNKGRGSPDSRVTQSAPVPALRAKPPLKRNMHSYLVDRLGMEIVGGVHPPGALLPNEAETCARFNVSRTTLREAYSVLAAKALIVARPKVGTRVRPKADWNMLDPQVLGWYLEAVPGEEFVWQLYVLRQMIEPECAALAASAARPATIEHVAAAYADMERCNNGDGDLIDADLRFHLAILGATDNHFINALGSMIHAALQANFKLSWEGAARMRDGRLHQHRDVYMAIRDGEPEVARDRMRVLLSDSIDDVREFLHGRQMLRPDRDSRQAASGKRRGNR